MFNRNPVIWLDEIGKTNKNKATNSNHDNKSTKKDKTKKAN